MRPRRFTHPGTRGIHRPAIHRLVISLLSIGLLAALGLPAGAVPVVADQAQARLPIACRTPPHTRAIANALLRDRYRLSFFPTVHLPHDLTWAEDPLREVNWLVRFHGMSWLDALTVSWAETGRHVYRSRVRSLVDDWVADNLDGSPASGFTWYDQATGMRGSAFACAAGVIGTWPRLTAALAVHGRMLADPSFYTGAGNHALDQMIGLLDVGHALGRRDWMTLARDRLARLVIASVSPRGVTNEQAVGYQAYNQRRYGLAAERLRAYGLSLPEGLTRVALMSRFLAHATLPNGEYDMVGDTEAEPKFTEPGSEAAFAASQGTTGVMPRATVASYAAEGWLFARTGWGTERSFADEAMMSLRFGPGPVFHGHADAGSLTLYGFGSRLVLDPGKYSYNPSRLRTWFKSRLAHNVVVGSGVRFGWSAARLARERVTDDLVEVRLRGIGTGSVTTQRTVVFSRALGYVVVEDRLRSPVERRWRQRWHLAEDARPQVLPDGFATRGPAGRLRIVDLVGASTGVVRGWVSYAYGRRQRAPIVELRRTGRSVRFVTILAPGDEQHAVLVADRSVTADGYAFTIAIGGRRERVISRGGTIEIVSIRPVAPASARDWRGTPSTVRRPRRPQRCGCPTASGPRGTRP